MDKLPNPFGACQDSSIYQQTSTVSSDPGFLLMTRPPNHIGYASPNRGSRPYNKSPQFNKFSSPRYFSSPRSNLSESFSGNDFGNQNCYSGKRSGQQPQYFESSPSNSFHNSSRGSSPSHNGSRGSFSFHNNSRGSSPSHNSSRGSSPSHDSSRGSSPSHNSSRGSFSFHNNSRGSNSFNNGGGSPYGGNKRFRGAGLRGRQSFSNNGERGTFNQHAGSPHMRGGGRGKGPLKDIPIEKFISNNMIRDPWSQFDTDSNLTNLNHDSSFNSKTSMVDNTSSVVKSGSDSCSNNDSILTETSGFISSSSEEPLLT